MTTGEKKERRTLADLAELPRWVAWQTIRQRARKPTKVPYSPSGAMAHADDPRTWGNRRAAQNRAAKLPRPFGEGGVGVMLGELGNGISVGGVDLDTCCEADGSLNTWAAEVVRRLTSYTEFSPSGTGAKVFFTYATADLFELRRIGLIEEGNGDKRAPGYGRQFKSGAGEHPPAIELYLGNRYFAVTGRKLSGVPVEIRRVALDDLLWLLQEPGPALAGKDKSRQRANRTDASRSALAFAKGAAMRRAGKTFEDLCAALHADPETAAWCREKGDAYGGRELQRIWDRAGPQNEGARTTTFYNPWEEPAPPQWPGGVLSREAEQTIAELSLRDGVDFGAQAMAYITAASGAAPKDARFAPYRNGGWSVPPIIWLMLIAESGNRKTAILDNAFTALRSIHGQIGTTICGSCSSGTCSPMTIGGQAASPQNRIVSSSTM